VRWIRRFQFISMQMQFGALDSTGARSGAIEFSTDPSQKIGISYN
jgi:hypothetical protein